MRVSVSAGTIASAPYPEICVVELQNGKKQFIQAVPGELSRDVTSTYIAYNSESHELEVNFDCWWALSAKFIRGGGKPSPPNPFNGEIRLNFPPENKFYVPYNGVRSVGLGYSIPVPGEHSEESAERLINRLLESGFKLELTAPRLLKLEGDEPLDGPALNNVVSNRAGGFIVRLGTAGIVKSGFTLGCPDVTTFLQPVTGSITVPAQVGIPITGESIKWGYYSTTPINKSIIYKIKEWGFVGNLPKYRCR